MKNLLVVTLLLFSTVVFTTMARGQDFEFQNPQFQTLSMDNVKVVTINTMKVSEAPKLSKINLFMKMFLQM